MTLQEIQYKAQGIIQKWRDDDSAPYVEFVEELATMQVPEPQGLDEAAEELFETIELHEYENIFEDTFKKIYQAGAKWMAEQGEFYEGKIQVSMRTGDLVAVATVPDEKYKFNDKVIVQIRKSE